MYLSEISEVESILNGKKKDKEKKPKEDIIKVLRDHGIEVPDDG